jgi:hypothetical protein
MYISAKKSLPSLLETHVHCIILSCVRYLCSMYKKNSCTELIFFLLYQSWFYPVWKSDKKVHFWPTIGKRCRVLALYIKPALFFNQWRYRILILQTSLDNAVYLGRKQLSEVEGIPFTSSRNICPEACWWKERSNLTTTIFHIRSMDI